ncbi:hypothetical protein VCRA2133E348_1050003 [Vibrio crassostreae]|nr:hypothetical protein VCRA2133E348_1050003 [Vibrio crassostreae]CAK3110841.1 hypothetical protein VCRA213O314_1090003 [Vibrio crassostreae]
MICLAQLRNSYVYQLVILRCDTKKNASEVVLILVPIFNRRSNR